MASEVTRRRPGGLEETLIEHSKADGAAWVPSHRVEHYVEERGWKLAKSSAKSPADRPSNPAPAGANTASTKEG